MLEIALEEIPQDSGVYFFRGERGEVLYVGKAKNLRARLANYFNAGVLNPKIQNLLNQAKAYEYFLTATEKEALLLEATLIKKYRPKYNVLLKDDKNYPMLRLSLQEPYPALQIVRKRRKGDKALYFGPFTSARGLREILKLLSKTFPLRKCSLAEMRRRRAPCLYFQIKKCLAPCVRPIPKEEYDYLVQGVIEFFQGKGKELLEKWRLEMHQLAENLEFERAAFLRDRIKDLELILEKQAVVLSEPKDLDLWEKKRVGEREFFIVLFVRYGYLYGYQTFSLKLPLHNNSIFGEVLLQYYLEGKIIPETIFIPEVLEEDEENFEKILSEYAGTQVRLRRIEGESQYEHLRSLALRNLENFIATYKEGKEAEYEKLAEELRKFLQLEEPPYHIEAIDLSQYAGQARVGAIVAFYQGNPDKGKYRLYKIKSEAKDDYTMLYEVVQRRLKRGLEERDLPDLLLIDGGKGHLEVALTAAYDLGCTKLAIRSIAKDEMRNPEKVYIPGRKNPKLLPKYQTLYQFIGKILLEAHRFAFSYSQKRLQMINFESLLDKIPGIGPKRKKILLTHIRDLKDLVSLSTEEIAKLPGFNLKIAKSIKEFLARENLENSLS